MVNGIKSTNCLQMTKRKSLIPEAKVQSGHPFFEIIEEAYQVFAVPRPASAGVWDYAIDAASRRDFLSLPIAELPYRCIRDWYFAPVDPPGIARSTWVYLLPRVLEILAVGRPVSEIGLEVSLDRYETGNPDNWSAAQWAVLDRFQRLYLQYAIGRREDNTLGSTNEQMDTVLCMFRLGGWSLDGLLEQVAAMSDAMLAERLWNDWCEGSPPGCEAVRITSFWPAKDKEHIRAWYTSPVLGERMVALALADDTSSDLANQAMAVAELIAASGLAAS